MIENLKEVGIILGIPVIRSVGGWLNNALEDKRITPFEVQELLRTVIRVETIAIMTYLGLGGLGYDVTEIGAVASAFIIDMLFGSLKKNLSVKK